LTFKDEITTLIENNVFWSDDDTCDISQDLPEKIIMKKSKKLKNTIGFFSVILKSCKILKES